MYFISLVVAQAEFPAQSLSLQSTAPSQSSSPPLVQLVSELAQQAELPPHPPRPQWG